jgi:uncharacterized repeat protein (TIGR03803 family)
MASWIAPVALHLVLPVAVALLAPAQARAASEVVLHSFDALDANGRNVDGAGALGGLMIGLDGKLHGANGGGGPGPGGTGFSITTAGAYAVKFPATINTPGPSNLESGLVQDAGGNFYGTSCNGGASGLGTVYQVTPGNVVDVLHSFSGVSSGYCPVARPVFGTDGALYGVTSQGGLQGGFAGTVYKVNTDGSGFEVLHAVDPATEGAGLAAALVRDAAGNFYGAAFEGGPLDGGTAFKITPAGKLSVLHAFSAHADAENAANGQGPSGLLLAADGNLYGTTYTGGPNDAGTFFRLTTTGVLTRMGAFGADGGTGLYPSQDTAPIQGGDGNFYGAAAFGGLQNAGTVFRVTPDGAVTVLYAFDRTRLDPANPFGPLVQGADGGLYGSADAGGANNTGAVFEIVLAAAAPTVSVSVNPKTIDVGEKSTLKWSSTGATSCNASGAWSGPQPLSGSLKLSPAAAGSYMYKLTCGGPGGSASDSAKLVVQ